MRKSMLVSVMIGVLVGGQAIGAFAGGFDNSGIGIKGMSMGGALVGIADDASAIYYNPAGLAMNAENTWDGEAYGYSVFTDLKYTANSIQDKSDETVILPGVFISRKQHDWAFGFGCYVPYAGGRSKYENFQGTPYNLEYEAGLVALTPAIAYRLRPDLSIGAGVSLYMGSMESSVFDPNVSTVVKSEYDDYLAGFGANLGLMYNPTKKVRIGVSVKSKVPVSMDGTVTIAGNATDSEVDFTLPYYFAAGIGYEVNTKLTFGFSAYYMLWGDMDNITFTTAGIENQMRTYYKNSWNMGLGMEYKMRKEITLRAGLRYMQGATKAEGLNPALNDVDLLSPSIGVGYRITEYLELDIVGSYAYGFEKEYNSQNFDQDNALVLVGVRLLK